MDGSPPLLVVEPLPQDIMNRGLLAHGMLGPGDRFPQGMTLTDDEGQNVHLDEVLRQGPAVLFFYPADNTPGCTREVCSFRDAHAELAEAGASVYGISQDSVASHRRFREKHALPYPLLSDPDRALAQRLGVPKVLGLMGGRVTFVVGSDHTIRHVYRSQIHATRHVQEALAALAAPATTQGPTVK